MLSSTWLKSSKSNPSGACLEAAHKRSSYSFANGNCPEAGSGDKSVYVRDTKQEHLGDLRTVLEFTPAVFAAFTERLKAGWHPGVR